VERGALGPRTSHGRWPTEAEVEANEHIRVGFNGARLSNEHRAFVLYTRPGLAGLGVKLSPHVNGLPLSADPVGADTRIWFTGTMHGAR